MMKNWAFPWDVRLDGTRIRSPANHQEGGADGLPLPAQKSDWTDPRRMSTTKELLMGYGREKENVSNQKQEMPICGSRSGKNCTFWLQEWKWSMSRHTAQRRTKKFELAKAGAM